MGVHTGCWSLRSSLLPCPYIPTFRRSRLFSVASPYLAIPLMILSRPLQICKLPKTVSLHGLSRERLGLRALPACCPPVCSRALSINGFTHARWRENDQIRTRCRALPQGGFLLQQHIGEYKSMPRSYLVSTQHRRGPCG